MPSSKPRLYLTLPDHVREAIDDLADALGKPSSKVVTELLEEAVPVMEGMAKAARAVQAGNRAAAKRALQHMLGDAMAELLTSEQKSLPLKRRK